MTSSAEGPTPSRAGDAPDPPDPATPDGTTSTSSVRRRLLLAFLALTAVTLVPAAYAGLQLAQLTDIAVDERSRHAGATLALGRFQAGLAELDRYARSYVAAPDEGLRAGMERALDSLRVELVRLQDFGYGASADSLRVAVDTLSARAGALVPLVEAGRLTAATDAFGRLEPAMDDAERLMTGVGVTIDRRGRRDFERARDISASAAWTTWAGVAGALLLAAIVALWTTRTLTRPLLRLRNAVVDVGEGDLDAPSDLPYDRDDEIGDLSRSFRSMIGRLAELDRMKSEFVGVATHELKNPINVIQGYAALMEDGTVGEVSEEQKDILAAVREQTHNLTRLVDRLLQISRLEAGRYPVQPERFETEALLSDVQRTFRVLAERDGIRVETRVEPDAPETLTADRDLLRHEVLGNLLSNALKYTPEGGDIRLTARGADGGILIEVSDSGPGIPEDKAPYIFEKYYQAGAKDRDLGSGLGLAIAREIVEAHGGTMTLEEAEGRGATFHISLPQEALPVGAETGDEAGPRENGAVSTGGVREGS